MKPFLIACLIVLLPFLFINTTLADICTDVEQKTGLDLNEAECYVLEQVEKGEIANFKESGDEDAKFQEKFSKIDNRTLGADFLTDLLTGTLPNLKIAEKGLEVWNAFIQEDLNLQGAKIVYPIKFVNCTFQRGTNFGGAQFSGNAEFIGSQFSDRTDFEEVYFSGDANFSGSKFSGMAKFSGAEFSGKADFAEAIFLAGSLFYKTQLLGKADFSGTKFSSWANFSFSEFSERATFFGAQFLALAQFSKARFSGESVFYEAQFSGRTFFMETKFLLEAGFYNTNFLDLAIFIKTNFSKNVNFGGAYFSGDADFFNAQFPGKANFEKARFSGYTDFSLSKFSGMAEFSSAVFSGNVDFKSTQFFDVVSFLGSKFRDSSYFGASQYFRIAVFNNVTGFSNMQIEWRYNPEKFGKEEDDRKSKRRGLKGRLEYNETFYIALIKNYRDMGLFGEADDCYYTYRVEKREHQINELIKATDKVETKPSSISRWWNKVKLYGEWLLLDLTFGYGVKPKKIFWTFVVFWGFFIPIYIVLLRHQWIRNQSWFKDLHKRFFRAIVFSLDTLTPGVNFRSESTLPPYTFSHSDFRKPIFNFCIRFQQILGWYWAALFLILFSKIWIR